MQVPTTVMAMVDSSVGGKTGVNHPLGKNMIGAFYQPQCVLADMETLKSLPDRELASGISEIVKYGLIFDPELFHWLEENVEKLLNRDSKVHPFSQSYCLQVPILVSLSDQRNGPQCYHAQLSDQQGWTSCFPPAVVPSVAYLRWLSNGRIKEVPGPMPNRVQLQSRSVYQ